MQTNIAIVANVAINKHAMMTKGQGRPIHLVSQSKKVRIWHRKFGHASNARIISASKLLAGMGEFGTTYDQAEIYSDSEASKPEDVDAEPESHNTLRASRITDSGSDFGEICEPCVESKQTRIVRRQKLMTPSEDKLEEVHLDLLGPHDPSSLTDSTYASILMCEKTRKSWVLYLRSEDEFVDAFQIWLPRVENESKCTLKTLCPDGGGEFISIKLRVFCEKREIALKYGASYMHEENSLAERGWRTIVTMKDSLLLDSGLPLDFWAKAMDTANYLRNRLPTKSQKGGFIPNKAWTKKQQDVSHLRVFGSLASVEISKEKLS